MTTNIFDRFLLLERSGNGKANTSVFEIRLNGKKVHVRHGNKGQKLQKKIYKKQSISEAIGLFDDKKKQKTNEGYRIISEQNKNHKNNNKNNHNSSNIALPISGKSIQNPNNKQSQNNNNNNNNKVLSQQSDEPSQQSHGRLKHGKQRRQNKHRKHSGKQIHKQKHFHIQNGNKPKKKLIQHKMVMKQNYSSNDDKENNHPMANGYSQSDNTVTDEEEEYESNINSDDDEITTTVTEEEEEEEEYESEDSNASNASSSSSSSASVESGRDSDSEYEMDYEKMSDVMYSAFNKQMQNEDLNCLEWKPIKLWIRFNEYNDLNGEYALVPQCQRIAGSCHELLVIYIRSKSKDSGYNDYNIIYKRLLKLARDPEEDNKYHFDSERNVSQYLHKIATCINNNFHSRFDVCIWPVETILFEYNGQLKYATIQTPFLPDKLTNNIFVKIEPNSGKPCVNDSIVGRYQHLFSSITRGVDLIRDWQGYGVTQEIFLDVCKRYNVQSEAINQIKIRKNKRLQSQTQVLIVIDPVLTTYNAHFFNNNPTDFGIKAIDEWIEYHNCVKCRCKYFNLLPINDIQFGFADPKQLFFDVENIQNKNVINNIRKCRYNLNIYQGDDFKIDESWDNDDDQ